MPRQIQPTVMGPAPQGQNQDNKGGLIGFVTNAISGNWPGAAASLLGVPEIETLANVAQGKVSNPGMEVPTPEPQQQPPMPQQQLQGPQPQSMGMGQPPQMNPEFLSQLSQVGSMGGPPISGVPGAPPAPPMMPPPQMLPPQQMPSRPGLQGMQQPPGFYTPPPFHLMQKYGNWWGSQF